MYFKSRAQAGQQLAAELLEKYRYENCAVVAMSDGAVLVGEQIANSLHCVFSLKKSLYLVKMSALVPFLKTVVLRTMECSQLVK
jgi:predicted phosphoribosyltransferase